MTWFCFYFDFILLHVWCGCRSIVCWKEWRGGSSFKLDVQGQRCGKILDLDGQGEWGMDYFHGRHMCIVPKNILHASYWFVALVWDMVVPTGWWACTAKYMQCFFYLRGSGFIKHVAVFVLIFSVTSFCLFSCMKPTDDFPVDGVYICLCVNMWTYGCIYKSSLGSTSLL